jgi:dTDP-4-dehydrorhamnose reductase
MKILLLGANGQIGWQLRRSLALLGEVMPLEVELRKPEYRDLIRASAPDVVVNAAAYTAVDRAENEPEAAMSVNAGACEALSELTRELGSWLVHFSTDYVYDGTGDQPWKETDRPAPLSVYGRSKLAGDQAVARNPKHLILRTSWVYDSWGQNFLKSILKAAATRDELAVVADQWGAPTRAALVADVTAAALQRTLADPLRLAGLYHVAATGSTTWHEYACLGVKEALARGMNLRATPDRIKPIAAAQYGAQAPRPANSRLDTSKLRNAFGFHLPHWKQGVNAVVAELALSHRGLT